MIDRETYRLATGDAIYFDSRLPHTIRALGLRPGRMLACLVNVHRPSSDKKPDGSGILIFLNLD